MYIVQLQYLVPLAEVLKVREAHVRFLDRFYEQKKFLFSGRKYDQKGGIILVNTHDAQEVHAIMQQDPFVVQQIAHYEIIGFEITKQSPQILLELR